jgi:hypothetical protein
MFKETAFEKKQFAKMRICILSPIMKAEPQWVRCLANMIAYSWHKGLEIHAMGMVEGMVVDWARNELANQAYHTKSIINNKHFTHFLWLDADHVFNPDLACCLAKHFIRKDVDGVSALYFHRDGPPMPVAYVKDDTEDEYSHNQLVNVPPALIEVDAFGFGACMMKRAIFGVVPKPWFTIDWKAGEDLAFCVKARGMGYRFFLDGAYRLGHIGCPPVVTYKDWEEYYNEHQGDYADRVKVKFAQ